MDSKPIYIKLVKVKNELKPRISSLIKYKLEPALALKEVFHLFKIVTKKIAYLGRQNGWDSLFDGFVRLFDISLIILASRGQSRI